MADRKAEFALQLTDEASGAAESVADALGNLRKSIEGDQRELAAMQKAMRNLQLGTVVNVEQFRKLKAQIDGKRQSIAAAQAQYLQLGGTFSRAGGQTRGLEARIAALQKQIVELPGPLGRLGASFGRIGGFVGRGGIIAAGILAIVAALGALVAASATAVAALAKYGIAQADARRSELLRLEGLTKLRFFYQRMPGNAQEMQAAIDKVSAITALGRDDLVKYNEQLYRMGLRGENLTLALEGVAIKAATQGDQAAQVFAGWAAGAALSGRSINRLVDDVRARLGPIATRQLLSLDVQTRKLKENFDALFRDLQIESFLGGLKVLTDLMSQSTASGKALKQLIEVLLRPLIADVTEVTPLVKRFFQGMILGVQSITIAILRFRLWWRNTFGGESVDLIDEMTLALNIGKAAVYLFGVALLVAGAVAAGVTIKLTTLLVPALMKTAVWLGAIAVKALVATWPILLTVAALWGLYQIFKLLHVVWEEIDWSALGKELWAGIVRGIKAGYEAIAQTMMDLGAKAYEAFASVLGIESPSKVFMKLGVEIPRGVGAGVVQGTPEAQRAVEEMIAPREQGTAVGAAAAGARSGGARGSMTFTFGDLHFHGSADRNAAKDFADDFKRQLASVLEGVAIEIGAPVAGEA
jgi:hypothetical protein